MVREKVVENRFSFQLPFHIASLLIIFSFWVLFFAVYGPPAKAQGSVSGLRNAVQNITRPAIENVRIAIRPILSIIRNRAGAVTRLYLSANQKLLFAVLDDGTVRLWDLKQGVQLGGTIGDEIVSGVFRDIGTRTEVVGIRRDGGMFSLQTDGSMSSITGRIQDIDSNVVPSISGSNFSVVYRSTAGIWHWKRGTSGLIEQLYDAVREMTPILSEDGKKLIYQTKQGRFVARESIGSKTRVVEFDGCSKNNARMTAGVFTPDGSKAVLGDEKGNLCAWRFFDSGKIRKIFIRRKAYPGSVHLLSVSRDGKFVAFGGDHSNVLVWSIKTQPRQLASIEIDTDKARSLILDTEREWLFLGNNNGIIGIYSFREKIRLARLISLKRGWAIIDQKGRFDGSQTGFNALVWVGGTDTETLPIEAFSDSYFEPALLAKLDDSSPNFLSEKIRDLSEDGYYPPPNVSIDSLHRQDINAQGMLSVKIRVSPDYKWDVDEVRLYHNGKLVSFNRASQNNKLFEYLVRVRPGENVFTAIGIGPQGIESQPASTSVTFDVPSRRQSEMQVVSVGIQEYGPPTLKLDYSRADAEAVADALQESGKNLFRGVSADTLLDSSASMVAIEKYIVQSSESQEDVLVIFLAGHGYALKEKSGWEWYFLPYTPDWEKGGIYERMIKNSSSLTNGIRKYGLPSRKLMDFVTKSEQQRVFLILDSCRSGAIVDTVSDAGAQFNDSAGKKAFHRIAQIGGIHILAATRADELAAELISVPHGALTYLVLQGMNGDADSDKDGVISVREIVDYATSEMPLLSQRFAEDIRQNAVGYSRGHDFSIIGGRI